MANDTGQGPAQQPKRLSATYSAILGVLGALTSILALVQLLTTENTLVITLLLAGVFALGGIALHHTWHSPDPRLKWLGSLTVSVLVLASVGGGYGLGRATAPAAAPGPTTAGAGANTAPPGATTGAGSGNAAPATTQPAGAQPLARVPPATTELGTFDSWKTESVSVEDVRHDEAIVATLMECHPDRVRYAEFVLGRKYKGLTGSVTLADDSEVTKPVPFVIVLDGKTQERKTVTTTTLELNVELNGVNRIRFELTAPGNSCTKYSKVAFVDLTAEP